MGFLGLDVLAVKALSRQLSDQARELEAMSKELTALLAQTEWTGADQRKFVDDWTSTHRMNLLRGRELLQNASEIALESARQQERTSRS